MAKSKRPKPANRDVHDGPHKGENEPEFRLHPRSPRNVGRGDMGWSIALRSVFRYARSSAKSQKTASERSANLRPRRAFNQRCAVRVTYSQNKTAGQWRAHGIYIARESASGKRDFNGFGSDEPGRDIASALDQWQKSGDERIWKVILSPEFGERLDLEQVTHDVMQRSEKHLGTPLQWIAVSHFNTEHPHVHLAIRGRRADGTPLNLPRDFIKQGLRSLAEDACTFQLGPRTELDAFAAREREVREHRYTSLDRVIERRGSSEGFGDSQYLRLAINAGAASSPLQNLAREQHFYARLITLREMGLADQVDDQSWHVRKDFSTVLRAMQLASDRQKMLASAGSLLSDERLRLHVLDFRKTPEVQGRILVHGEEEQSFGTGRHYLLLEGTDAQVHMIFYTPEMEDARSRGKLKTNSFVRLQKRFMADMPTFKVDDFGNANELLRNKMFLNTVADNLIRQGVVPNEEGWGGWLGQYQSAVSQAVRMSPDPSRSRAYER